MVALASGEEPAVVGGVARGVQLWAGAGPVPGQERRRNSGSSAALRTPEA